MPQGKGGAYPPTVLGPMTNEAPGHLNPSRTAAVLFGCTILADHDHGDLVTVVIPDEAVSFRVVDRLSVNDELVLVASVR